MTEEENSGQGLQTANLSFWGKIIGTVSLTAVDFSIRVLESEDGRNFNKSFTMKFPFYLQFSIIDEGDYYRAYGSHPAPAPFGKDIRYPVLATSKDGVKFCFFNISYITCHC